MPSEMWGKIKAASDAINHQEALRHQIKPPRYQVPSLPLISKETLKHRYRDPFLKIIKPIIEDIRSNHQPIVSANQSDILEIEVDDSNLFPVFQHLDEYIFKPTTTPNLLVLRWGNKLGPNEEELSLLKTDTKPMFYPAEMLISDYECVSFGILDRTILTAQGYDFLEIKSETFKIDKLTEDPSIVAATIAEALRKPTDEKIIYHYHRIKRFGQYKHWHHINDTHEEITYFDPPRDRN